MKTIDKYLIGCFLFVFATLAEYSLVLFLANRMKRYQQSDEYKKSIHKNIDVDRASTCSDKHLSNGDGVVNRVRKTILSFYIIFYEINKIYARFDWLKTNSNFTRVTITLWKHGKRFLFGIQLQLFLKVENNNRNFIQAVSNCIVFKTRPCRLGVYLNLEFIQGPAFIRECESNERVIAFDGQISLAWSMGCKR